MEASDGLEPMVVEPIGMDVPVQERYPSFVERYFTPRYVLDVHCKGDDICVLFHSNRICLITLAPSHPVLAQNKKVVSVDFDADESEEELRHLKRKHRNQNSNRMDLKVRGKKKKGAIILHKRSLLCNVECDDGTVYSIRSGIPGLLVEINERLIKNPNMLVEKPSSEGFVAILLPKTLESDRLKDRLMTPEQYGKALDDRVKREEDSKLTEESSDQESKADPFLTAANGNASGEKVNMALAPESKAKPSMMENVKEVDGVEDDLEDLKEDDKEDLKEDDGEEVKMM